MITLKACGARRATLSLLAAVGLAACVGGIGARTPSSNPRDGTYVLESVGGRVLETRARNERSCSLRPFWGRIVLRADTWIDAESLFVNCSSARPATLHFRTARGTYAVRTGDSLDFFAPEAGRDSSRPVFSGIFQGKSLILFGDDEGMGDYFYRRQPGLQ
jgi:hypothetical protein